MSGITDDEREDGGLLTEPNELQDETGRSGSSAPPVSGNGDSASTEATLARLAKLEQALQARERELEALELQRQILLRVSQKAWSSRTWRWSGLPRRVSRLVGARPLTEAELIPGPGLTARPEGGWTATGEDPQLVLPCLPVSGWVRVEVELWTAQPSWATVYYDTGGRFNEGDRIDLGAVSGETRRELLFLLPRPVHCFRLDPMRERGEFAVKQFRITPLAGLAVDARSLLRRWKEFRSGRPVGDSLRNGLKYLRRGDFHGFRAKLRAALSASTADNGADYELWREKRRLTDARREALVRRAAEMTDPPLLSVLMPTYNTPEKWLRAAIESVLGQTYPHWELCVADDCSSDPEVKRVLDEYARRDPRVRVTYRQSNGNISAASNTALEMALGSYVALLDHDDALAPHALSSVAEVIVADRSTDMIYSDEDKLTTSGKHLDPFFKPDWSPEYFLACMYTCHLGVYRTALVREVGGFRSEFDQAQDYDLVLRVTARTNRVVHIPDVLYHWRIIPGSTALNADAKPKAHHRAQAALKRAMADRGWDADVSDGPTAGYHRVRPRLKSKPRVTVVIPSACRERDFGGKIDFWARRCVHSLRTRSTYPDLQVVVIGPGEVPERLEEELARLGVLRATYATPFNFSQACNAGAERGDGEQILFLNDDIEVLAPDFVEEMLAFSQIPEIGCVGARLLFPDGMLQHVGVTVLEGKPGHAFYRYPSDHPGYFFSARVHRNWSAVTAACMMVRRDVFRQVGGFDESFPLNYNDVDLCLRIREAGYRVVYTPHAELMHHESVTKAGWFASEIAHFQGRWLKKLPLDPMYSPNLSSHYGDFRIAP